MHGYSEPTLSDWRQALPNLTWSANRAAGECPLCGGDDRFHLTETAGGRVLVGCRQCLPNGRGAERKARFKELMARVFPNRQPVRTNHTPAKPRPATRDAIKASPESAATMRKMLERSEAVLYPDTVPRDHPAYRYLHEVRSLPNHNPFRFDETQHLRWCPRHDGSVGWLIYVFRDPRDRPTGIGVELLDADGNRVIRDNRPVKRNYGVKRDALFMPGKSYATPREIVLCEGEMDALSLWCAFDPDQVAVAATGGLNGLVYRKWLERYERVCVATDSDPTSLKRAMELLEAASAAGQATRLMTPRARHKDVNEALAATMQYDPKNYVKPLDLVSWRGDQGDYESEWL